MSQKPRGAALRLFPWLCLLGILAVDAWEDHRREAGAEWATEVIVARSRPVSMPRGPSIGVVPPLTTSISIPPLPNPALITARLLDRRELNRARSSIWDPDLPRGPPQEQ